MLACYLVTGIKYSSNCTVNTAHLFGDLIEHAAGRQYKMQPTADIYSEYSGETVTSVDSLYFSF